MSTKHADFGKPAHTTTPLPDDLDRPIDEPTTLGKLERSGITLGELERSGITLGDISHTEGDDS
jgi:hypothetical protein